MTRPDPRYPIGQPRRESSLAPARRAELISEIADLPARLHEVTGGLSEAEWQTPYREGGWNARQVVHHLADSHINFYVRVRLALTESTPTIKPYLEALWAELPDARESPPEISIALIEGIHLRLANLFRSLPPEAFARGVHHPEHGRTQTLDELLCVYSWHGRHHIAHIEAARVAATGGTKHGE